MTTRLPYICISCTRYQPKEQYEDQETCEAYPDGIPQRFLIGLDDHSEHSPDDNGIKYEQDPDMEQERTLYEEWKNSSTGQYWIEATKTSLEEAGIPL